MKRVFILCLVIVIGSATVVAQDEDPALYAIGALSASNLYNTYFLLGTLADGYANAAYPASFARDLTRDVIGLSESAVDVLGELVAQDDVVPEDRRLVERMIQAHNLLINQAWGLISYIDDPEDTDDWFTYKEQAWEEITSILGIAAE